MAKPKFIIGRSSIEERYILKEAGMRTSLFKVLKGMNGFYSVKARQMTYFGHISNLPRQYKKIFPMKEREWRGLQIIIVDGKKKNFTSDEMVELVRYFLDTDKYFYKLPRVDAIYDALEDFEQGEAPKRK